MSLEKSTPYRNAWYRDLLEKEKELKEYTDKAVEEALELPEVTSADNGDVLQVIDGKWDKGPELKDVIVFNCTDSSTPTLDNGKTVNDLITAFNEGYVVIVKWKNNEFIMTKIENNTVSLITGNVSNGIRTIIFLIGLSGEGVNTFSRHTALCVLPPTEPNKVLISTSDRWVQGDFPTELPEVSASDNGKVLMVVNGQWAVGEVANIPVGTTEIRSIDNISAEGE